MSLAWIAGQLSFAKGEKVMWMEDLNEEWSKGRTDDGRVSTACRGTDACVWISMCQNGTI